MSRSRRKQKQRTLAVRANLCAEGYCYHISLYECLDQLRHNRRVYGHPNEVPCESIDVCQSKPLWNQPAALWMGNGERYRRRVKNRTRRS